MTRSPGTHVDDPKHVARRLRSARESAGLSQRQLSFQGCTPAYISRIESAARVPSLQMINELAGRLGVSAQWLATGVEPLDAESAEILDADVAARVGDLDEARRLYESRLRPSDPAYAAALAGLGQIAFREENVPEAIQYLEQALEVRKRSFLADPGAVETLGRAYAATGDRENAIALFSQGLTAAKEVSARIEELRFAVLLANVLIDHGTLGDAEETLAGVIHLATELKDPLVEARLYWSQSRLHAVRGEPVLAAKYARRALDILERTENDSYVGMAYHLLAFAEIESGNGEAALELLSKGRELFGGEMSERDVAKFALEEARALLVIGRKRKAATIGATALELIESIDPGDRGRAYVALGDIFGAVGERDTAQSLYERGIELLREYGKSYVLAASRRLADLLEAEGDIAGALAVLKRATDVSEAGPARHVLAGRDVGPQPLRS